VLVGVEEEELPPPPGGHQGPADQGGLEQADGRAGGQAVGIGHVNAVDRPAEGVLGQAAVELDLEQLGHRGTLLRAAGVPTPARSPPRAGRRG
jgi:hypothetical protein